MGGAWDPCAAPCGLARTVARVLVPASPLILPAGAIWGRHAGGRPAGRGGSPPPPAAPPLTPPSWLQILSLRRRMRAHTDGGARLGAGQPTLLPAGGGFGSARGRAARGRRRGRPHPQPHLRRPLLGFRYYPCVAVRGLTRTVARVWVPTSPFIYGWGRSGAVQGLVARWAGWQPPPPAAPPLAVTYGRDNGSICRSLCARTGGCARFGAGQPGGATATGRARRLARRRRRAPPFALARPDSPPR